MLGAIIGDIVGSRFEFSNAKTKVFEFFATGCEFTDDTVMTLAVAKALLESEGDHTRLNALVTTQMREIGRLYPMCGFGQNFFKWVHSDTMGPYGSYGNGAAMRVSPCGFAADTVDAAKLYSLKVTEVTHNHLEGLKGAEATAACIFLAKTGTSIPDIRDYVHANYYPMDFTLDKIRESYVFDASCQRSVPQAIAAFLESTSFEDAIRNAISLGGDSDTMAAITGGIAEAHYGIPQDIREHALTFLDERLLGILAECQGN
ncbi:MAG: ADP-ribosylglycohydrolase family protein [Chitinispirillia bacterium]|nr:ADP-ribosylglycohydrolase family protein [Chitinispirillia bacterium]MCL2268864.1 ADP-ribosylglycohydrolase family protein [Chitinispirillia bacterium]